MKYLAMLGALALTGCGEWQQAFEQFKFATRAVGSAADSVNQLCADEDRTRCARITEAARKAALQGGIVADKAEDAVTVIEAAFAGDPLQCPLPSGEMVSVVLDGNLVSFVLGGEVREVTAEDGDRICDLVKGDE